MRSIVFIVDFQQIERIFTYGVLHQIDRFSAGCARHLSSREYHVTLLETLVSVR